MPGTPSPDPISTRRQRIAELARQSPQAAFTTLAHHIDIDWLHEAYRRTRKDGAAGVDGQTAADYAADLEGNLRSLLDRAKSGRYQAPPVRRVHIPKGTGSETRPIGIPTFEDKILQRAVAMVLEAVYEQDFLDCSYGFRPGRSAHQALDALWQRLMEMGGGWVLEIDIRKFFDALDHRHLHAILRRRVRDGVLLRLIGKWLKAGVLEDGCVTHPESGRPQGGVISPLLANAYLHEVLDTWFEQTVKPRLKGRASLIRYADDAVLVFEEEGCATGPGRAAEAIREVRPDPPSGEDPAGPVPGASPGAPTGPRDGARHVRLPGVHPLLGSDAQGELGGEAQDGKDRFRRPLSRVADWCRRHRHLPIWRSSERRSRKLRGHFAYYGITGNIASLEPLSPRRSNAGWHKWLSRRSEQARITVGAFRRALGSVTRCLRPESFTHPSGHVANSWPEEPDA